MDRTRLVGRDGELALLREQFGRARRGEARIVFVRGEAGIGKTSLAAAAVSEAPDFTLLKAAGEESEQDLAYGVVDQLFGHLGGGPAAGAGPTPLAVGAAFLRALSDAQARAPLLLLVDDLQWADRSSQHAISFALRRLQADQICAILCLRSSSESTLTSGMSRLQGSPHATTHDLEGLSSSAVAELAVRESFALPGHAVDRLRDHTGGRPLWTLSLLREVPRDVLLAASARLPAPRSFSDLTADRLSSLSPSARALVEAAAVHGAAAHLGLLSSVGGVDDPFGALEEAAAAALLVSDGGTPPLVRVAHSLVGSAVYDSLGEVRRVDLHKAWSRSAPSDHDRLRHEVSASPGHDAALSDRVASAAAAAASAGAWSEAATLWESAAQLSPAHDVRRSRLQESVASALTGGDVARASTFVESLRQVDSLLASPRSRTVLGWLAIAQGRPAEANSMLEDAVAAAESEGDLRTVAEASRLLGHVLVLLGRADHAVRHARRALDLDPPLSIESGISRAILVIALATDGNQEEAERVAGDERPLVRPDQLMVGVSRGTSRVFRGDFAGAVEDLSDVIRASRGIGGFEFLCAAWSHLSRAHYCLGDWDAAVATSEQAVSIAVDTQQAWAMSAVHAHAAFVPARRGSWVVAEAMSISYAATAAAVLEHSRGDHRGVLNALEPLMKLEHRVGTFMPGSLEWPNLFGEALVRCGELDSAEEFLLGFLAASDRRQSPWPMSAARRSLGLLKAAQGNEAAAISLFDESSAVARESGMPFELAESALEKGVLLSRAGNLDAGKAEVTAASGGFASLGAVPFTDRADRILAGLGASPALRASPPRVALTPQEIAVSRLVRKGLSNREIATELFLSTKTVEFHLSHVYLKLGVRSRTQLVARSAELLDLRAVEDRGDSRLGAVEDE
jgi:DNA-binding CsgD family transcriptional regulator/tetratricopeptide (TPR) repeat protein